MKMTETSTQIIKIISKLSSTLIKLVKILNKIHSFRKQHDSIAFYSAPGTYHKRKFNHSFVTIIMERNIVIYETWPRLVQTLCCTTFSTWTLICKLAKKTKENALQLSLDLFNIFNGNIDTQCSASVMSEWI